MAGALGHRPRYPVKFDTRHNSFGVKSTYPVFVAAGELNDSGCWYAPFSGNGCMNDLRSLSFFLPPGGCNVPPTVGSLSTSHGAMASDP